MLTRRGLLRALLTLPLAASASVRSLFSPARPFFTPKYYEVSVPISLDELNRVTMAAILPSVRDDFFKSNALLAYLQEGRAPNTELWQPRLPDTSFDALDVPDWDEVDEA